MNLFSFTPNPPTNAMVLDDARLIKMILESGQILCSALHLNARHIPPEHLDAIPYKPTHIHHPVVQWAARGSDYMQYIYETMIALEEERQLRFPDRPVHATVMKLYDAGFLMSWVPSKTGDFHITKHIVSTHRQLPNCAANASLNLDYKHYPVYEAYQKYIYARWLSDIRKPKWTTQHIVGRGNLPTGRNIQREIIEEIWSPKNTKSRLSIRNDLTRGVIPSIIPK